VTWTESRECARLASGTLSVHPNFTAYDEVYAIRRSARGDNDVAGSVCELLNSREEGVLRFVVEVCQEARGQEPVEAGLSDDVAGGRACGVFDDQGPHLQVAFYRMASTRAIDEQERPGMKVEPSLAWVTKCPPYIDMVRSSSAC
jgi:hypothetical protein